MPSLRGSSASLPLYRIDLHGQPRLIARMRLLHPHGSALDFLEPFGWPLDEDMRSGRFEGLPYPLQDMRPQGFLGRFFARYYAPLLQSGENPNTWSDDDVLHALSLLGAEAPGDLLLGDGACELWLDHVRQIAAGRVARGVTDADLPGAFPALARLILSDGIPGSSAAGEFPKFPTLRLLPDGSSRHVLVKFTGNDELPATRRWADLLVCEHLAGRVLSSHLRIPAAASRLHAHAGRTFLEIDRFDRHGVLGRSPVVSWFALNATFVGSAGRPWHEATRPLLDMAWLTGHDLDLIERVWHFGRLIANNDMHDGNLSFQPVERAGKLVFQPAPIYDMLPMTYAPAGGVTPPEKTIAASRPADAGGIGHASEAAWRAAADAAHAFWRMAAADDRISLGFRALCERNAEKLAACRADLSRD